MQNAKGRIKMAYDFSAEEVFTMAEQIELNGVNFYRDAAKILSGLLPLPAVLVRY